MSNEPPTPPAELPTEMVNTLNKASPERLRAMATYAEALADHKEREDRLGGDGDEEEPQRESLPADVPSKATITIKEINDNRYYYWQWREGEKIKSKYKGPVSPEE